MFLVLKPIVAYNQRDIVGSEKKIVERNLMLYTLWTLLFTATDTQQAADNPEKTDDTPQKHQDIRAYGGYGVLAHSKPDLSDMTEELQQVGIAPADITYSGGGGGSLITRGNVVIESGGYGRGWSKKDEHSDIGIGEGNGHASVGYILYQKALLRVFPLVGFFGSGQGVSMERDEKTILERGDGRFGVHVGLGVDFKLPLWRLRLLFGLRVGYRLMIGKATAVEKTMPGNPFFFRAQVGFDIVQKQETKS